MLVPNTSFSTIMNCLIVLGVSMDGILISDTNNNKNVDSNNNENKNNNSNNYIYIYIFF